MIVDAVLGQRGAVILLDVGFVGSCLVTFYGMVKMAYQRRMGRVLDTPVTRWLDIGADVFSNALGAVNKAFVAAGRAPILPHPDVVAAEARADAAEAQVATQGRASMLVAPLRVPTLPGVPTVPHTGE